MNDASSAKLNKTGFAEAVRDTYCEEILSYETSDLTAYKAVEPDETQKARLYQSAEALPENVKNAIIGLCCFGLPAEDVAQMYGVTHPVGMLRYYTRLLSRVSGLAETEILSEEAMRRTGEHILRSFEKEVATKKDARRAKRRGRHRMLRYIGYAVAVLLLCFSIPLTVSAELRAVVLKWFFRDRVEYSEYTPVLDYELSVEEMYLYEPTYIPEGYILEGRHEESTLVDYAYLDKDDWYLMITISLPGYTTLIDTENAEITKTEFRGAEATIILSPDGYNHLTCSIDDYPVYVSGRFEPEELIKIAESIKKR